MKKSPLITITHSRAILALLWGLFFVVNLGTVVALYMNDAIGEDNFWSALNVINSLYVTYCGAIIAFYVTKRVLKPAAKGPAMAAFLVALICSLSWNLLISAFFLRLVFARGNIESSIAQVSRIGPLLSWLVAPILGFYFAAAHSSPSPGEEG